MELDLTASAIGSRFRQQVILKPNLDFITTTGAIVVYFMAYPRAVPDGISFLYDSVTYNTLTSNTDGRITANAGTNNIIGSSSWSCTEASLIAGSGTDGY